MKLGIVGLPNVGKSTLFNAITNAGAESANYPFCTIEPNVGMVAVPDARLIQTNGERIYFDALSPYVDEWSFSQHVFGDAKIMTYPKRLAEQGKIASMYACGTSMRQDPYRYYRW